MQLICQVMTFYSPLPHYIVKLFICVNGRSKSNANLALSVAIESRFHF